MITADQADAVSRSVLAAWMAGERQRADRFASAPDVVDALFSRDAPSSELRGDNQEGCCSRDEDTGSYVSCSYSVVDDSADGVLAVATTVAVIDGRVLVTDAGFAEWND